MFELLAQSDTDTMAGLVREFGLPVALVIILLGVIFASLGTAFMAAGMAINRLAAWLAPMVVESFQKQNSLVERLEIATIKREELDHRTTEALETMSTSQTDRREADQRTAKTLESIASNQERLAVTQTGIHGEVIEMRKLQEKIDKRISDSTVSIGISAETVNMPATEEERKAMERIERRKPQ
jgi:hypothetical protein